MSEEEQNALEQQVTFLFLQLPPVQINCESYSIQSLDKATGQKWKDTSPSFHLHHMQTDYVELWISAAVLYKQQ